MALPYPDMDFVPFDILTAQELDQLVANIEADVTPDRMDMPMIGTASSGYRDIGGGWVRCWLKTDLNTNAVSEQIRSLPVSLDPNYPIFGGMIGNYFATNRPTAGDSYSLRLRAYERMALSVDGTQWSARLEASITVGTVSVVLWAEGRLAA